MTSSGASAPRHVTGDGKEEMGLMFSQIRLLLVYSLLASSLQCSVVVTANMTEITTEMREVDTRILQLTNKRQKLKRPSVEHSVCPRVEYESTFTTGRDFACLLAAAAACICMLQVEQDFKSQRPA